MYNIFQFIAHDQKIVLGIVHENWLRIDGEISKIICDG